MTTGGPNDATPATRPTTGRRLDAGPSTGLRPGARSDDARPSLHASSLLPNDVGSAWGTRR